MNKNESSRVADIEDLLGELYRNLNSAKQTILEIQRMDMQTIRYVESLKRDFIEAIEPLAEINIVASKYSDVIIKDLLNDEGGI